MNLKSVFLLALFFNLANCNINDNNEGDLLSWLPNNCWEFELNDVAQPPPNWGEPPNEWLDGSQGQSGSNNMYIVQQFNNKGTIRFRTPHQLPIEVGVSSSQKTASPDLSPKSGDSLTELSSTTDLSPDIGLTNLEHTLLDIEPFCLRWRPKIMTDASFKKGIYAWKVWIPSIEEKAQVSIGAFLYSNQSSANGNDREIDFEICYGKEEARHPSDNSYDIPDGKYLCYMTVHKDELSGTDHNSEIFNPTDIDDHISPGNWYTLIVKLTETDGKYNVEWYIQKNENDPIKARSDYQCNYGPNNDFPTDFRIFCSLENLEFCGDECATHDHNTFFDKVCYREF